MVVYLDVVMLLNFLVDLLLLLGTNRLAGFPAAGRRCVLAAGLGAVYSGAYLLPRFYFLGNTLWRMVCLSLMAAIAFGWDRSGLRRGMVFVLLSMALGGIAIGMGEGRFDRLILSAAGVWLLCRAGMGDTLGQTYIPVIIREEERTLRFVSLKDTGNTLRDPITGEQVIVLGADAAQDLTGLPPEAFFNPMETMVAHPGFRLIPYHAVGQPGGMLLAKRYADVQIGDSRGKALIAFAPEIIDRAGNYQALTGGAL